ncbi:MAG: hypothetical protein GWN01_11390 [Nitrosopumilaceae archaeon]|nr:hypothetical protein [Nitrosopumilaceae archaeon]NIU87913.1 hypothetical protein [Nitrosopumilaceae archaeon]NIV66200.1 hypothetical protein [Nitrosopumilaceae archaeon]NIX62088.1 hypothetical protein [Nitrosopumilaceae archaeon]
MWAHDTFFDSKKYHPEPVVKVEHVYHYTACPVDEKPNYVELVKDSHLGSARNANILIQNLEIMEDYNQSLLNTIECYEDQVEEKDE